MKANALLVVRVSLLVCLASIARAQGADPYQNLQILAGDSHKHHTTNYSLLRLALDPVGLQSDLSSYIISTNPWATHEQGSTAESLDFLRNEGYGWGSVSHHDTNHPPFPGQTVAPGTGNIAVAESSAKWIWWRDHVAPGGFWDGIAILGPPVSPPWSEARSLSRVSEMKTTATFLAFAGREFTNQVFQPTSILARGGGHKILILPGNTYGICMPTYSLNGDEWCPSEYDLYRWMQSQVPDGADPADLTQPRPVIIQAHPGPWSTSTDFALDLRPVHPLNAPGGASDAFIEGVEVAGTSDDLRWEPQYRQYLKLGYRVFPAFGSDSHVPNDYDSRTMISNFGATICWIDAMTRPSLLRAMHLRRCYYSAANKPTLKFQMRESSASPWVLMGSTLDLADGRADVRVTALNDPLNNDASANLGRRFDVLELLDANGTVLASCDASGTAPQGVTTCVCTRSATLAGSDSCTFSADDFALPNGAIYPRVRMLNPDPSVCLSPDPALRANCEKIVLGAPMFVNWNAYKATTPYRSCTFDVNSLPCVGTGCSLPGTVDSDGDGFPNTCDVCPDVADPTQPDADRTGYGDLCNDSRDPDGDDFELADNCPTTANADQINTDGLADGGDACDPNDDLDSFPDVSDNCRLITNQDQADGDQDGVGDVCDNCPTVANADQLDTGDVISTTGDTLNFRADGVGDACDNCQLVWNPKRTFAANRTTTGGQLDDDADGYGNACDLDTDNDGVVRNLPFAGSASGYCGESLDFQQYYSSSRPVSALDCGASGTIRCELFDLDGIPIGTGDLIRFRALVRGESHVNDPVIPLGPKCPTCPLECVGDACSAPDTDGDGVRDPLDNCPTVANADQLDLDFLTTDGVGQACDSCLNRANPRVPMGCLALNPWMTTTGAVVPAANQLSWITPRGGQRDDDADGYGNICDGQFVLNGAPLPGPADAAEMNASLTKSRATDTCGTSATRPCAIFDVSESEDLINTLDSGLWAAFMSGTPPGPRCSNCGNFSILTCVGENCPSQ